MLNKTAQGRCLLSGATVTWLILSSVLQISSARPGNQPVLCRPGINWPELHLHGPNLSTNLQMLAGVCSSWENLAVLSPFFLFRFFGCLVACSFTTLSATGTLLICHLPSFQGYPDITVCGLKYFCCWLLAPLSLTVAVPCWRRSNDFRCPCCSSVFLSYSDLNSYIWICCSSVAVRVVRRHKARLFHFRIWQ